MKGAFKFAAILMSTTALWGQDENFPIDQRNRIMNELILQQMRRDTMRTLRQVEPDLRFDEQWNRVAEAGNRFAEQLRVGKFDYKLYQEFLMQVTKLRNLK